jgi:hypothetical protein
MPIYCPCPESGYTLDPASACAQLDANELVEGDVEPCCVASCEALFAYPAASYAAAAATAYVTQSVTQRTCAMSRRRTS